MSTNLSRMSKSPTASRRDGSYGYAATQAKRLASIDGRRGQGSTLPSSHNAPATTGYTKPRSSARRNTVDWSAIEQSLSLPRSSNGSTTVAASSRSSVVPGRGSAAVNTTAPPPVTRHDDEDGTGMNSAAATDSSTSGNVVAHARAHSNSYGSLHANHALRASRATTTNASSSLSAPSGTHHQGPRRSRHSTAAPRSSRGPRSSRAPPAPAASTLDRSSSNLVPTTLGSTYARKRSVTTTERRPSGRRPSGPDLGRYSSSDPTLHTRDVLARQDGSEGGNDIAAMRSVGAAGSAPLAHPGLNRVNSGDTTTVYGAHASHNPPPSVYVEHHDDDDDDGPIPPDGAPPPTRTEAHQRLTSSMLLVKNANLTRTSLAMAEKEPTSFTRRDTDLVVSQKMPSRVSNMSTTSDTSSLGYEEDDEVIEAHLINESKFFRACYYGDLPTAKRYVKAGQADINALGGDFFDKNDPLHIACSRGFTDIVAFLLHLECKEHRRNAHGETALFLAAKYGHLDCAKRVSQAGAKREHADKQGRSPLFVAAEHGHLDLVRYLNEAGASKYKQAKDGRTALYAACEHGHLNVVLYLLQATAERERRSRTRATTAEKKDGADGKEGDNMASTMRVEFKDRPNKVGVTPLAIAAKKNHADVVRYLLKLGAQKEKADDFGLTPLMMAAQHENVSLDIVEALLEAGASVHVKDHREQTALYKAAMSNNADTVRLLLRHRAKVDDTTSDGWTPLHVAASKGHTEVIGILLSHRANPSAETLTGATPLQLAAEHGFFDALLRLQTAANNVNKEDMDGATPLLAAAAGGHTEIVRSLLKFKADHSRTTSDGTSPLIAAAENGHTDVVRLLLRAGTDVNQANYREETALSRAALNGHLQTVDALMSWPKCARDQPDRAGNSPLHVACLAERTELFIFMIDAGSGKDCLNANGESVLHVACRRGLLDVVRHLINAGAHKDKAVGSGRKAQRVTNELSEEASAATDAAGVGAGDDPTAGSGNGNDQPPSDVVKGDTPLLVATRFGHLQLVQYLIACEANKEAVNERGDTALIVACRHNHIAIVKHLLRMRVDLEKKNADHETALAAACAAGHEEIVRTLCDANAEVDAQLNNKETPLFCAARHNCVNIISALTGDYGANVKHRSEDGKTALYVACEHGMSEAVVALLEAPGGTQALDTVKSGGWTAVHIAAYMGRPDITQHVMSMPNVNLNRTTDKGSTPLYLAAQQGHIDVVNQLCQVDRQKVDINHRQRQSGPTPLIIAAKHGHVEVCDLLIKAGADINAETGVGVNVVHTAAIHRHNPVLRLLIDAGAYPLSQNHKRTKAAHR
eukprot:m.77084 g.77084  ORF g.77084 m.77084 type:complete len:1322 (+) comp9113_c0_seq1:214-4179(+)